MKLIDLNEQYSRLKSRIDRRVQAVLSDGQYIMGPEVSEFEGKFSQYIGVNHVVGCANGTDALQLALMAIGVKPGDAVFVPSFTFVASAEVIALLGATPVFVDVLYDSYSIDPESLSTAISKVRKVKKLQPKAVVAVDLFGIPADYDRLNEICVHNQLVLIEDAAQGIGGSYHDRKLGSVADIAATSFFPSKPLGCYGDGGAVLTDKKEYAEIIRSLSLHGKNKEKYDNIRVGVNSRLDTLQAAILLEKLTIFDQELKIKEHISERYRAELSDDYVMPLIPQYSRSAWAICTLRCSNRNSAISKLKKNNIASAIYYPKCLHQQDAFRYNSLIPVDLSQSETASREVFSIPMHPYLSESDISLVISVLNSV